MKAFEKRFPKPYCDWDKSNLAWKDKQEGWEAALEWLLTQRLCGYSSDIVKKELGNRIKPSRKEV